MSIRAKDRPGLSMGYDSFLDIVANLVGILIILVVVVGTQTGAAMRSWVPPVDAVIDEPPVAPRAAEATAGQTDRLAAVAADAARAQADSMRLERSIAAADQRLEILRAARGQLMDLVAVAQEAWDDEQTKLDQERVEAAKLNVRLAAARGRVAELQAERMIAQNQKPAAVSLAHLPTPMAKTVFGDEIDLRLTGGRLSVVPLESLMEMIKEDFQSGLTRRAGRTERAVGPVDGYVARYVVASGLTRVQRDGRSAMVMAQQVDLVQFVPVDETPGTPVEEALSQRGGVLDIQLAGRDPASTTITVWVYPDGFGDFRRLKEELYRRGFATAARPLPHGAPIAGSPRGSQSVAQ